MNQITKTIEFGNRKLSLETGNTRQATGSVVVNYDETVVLVTVVTKRGTRWARLFSSHC